MAEEEEGGIRYESYHGEEQLPLIMSLIDQELSEPYSIFTYRYFITLWPNLCFLMGQHRSTFRGYIAMLVVIKPFRGKGIATELVTRCIQVMRDSGCDEVTLEAEVTNKGALALYGNLGFIRAKRLHKYYLNGVDAFRLKLLFPRPADPNSLYISHDDYALEHSHHGCSHSHDHDHGHSRHMGSHSHGCEHEHSHIGCSHSHDHGDHDHWPQNIHDQSSHHCHSHGHNFDHNHSQNTGHSHMHTFSCNH
ncbi:hypothetical protein O6H91_09G039400 [Diphasiastrum complanatum]|uniref:Uncharacterized protein n=1 Tax=Diphasiastrum complanatum TaxID=34168 RepID=A0ACC2CN66_DIPCM|nr:hypothetical protein O6H91_09G039400 [Diphasiastrum complanatum]